MSIVEQSVDCLKNEERIKDISPSHPGDVIKAIAKEMTVEMDVVDTVEGDSKSEKQTNGSASKLKEQQQAEETNAKKSSETESTPTTDNNDVANSSKTDSDVEKMDVDAPPPPTNGNGVKDATNGDAPAAEVTASSESLKENTDETEVVDDSSGEGKKTGSEVASDDNKDTVESNSKNDDENGEKKNEEMAEVSKITDDLKTSDTNTDVPESATADVEVTAKESSEECKTEIESSNTETDEIKNNNESSEKADDNAENSDEPPRKKVALQVKTDADVQKESNSQSDKKHTDSIEDQIETAKELKSSIEDEPVELKQTESESITAAIENPTNKEDLKNGNNVEEVDGGSSSTPSSSETCENMVKIENKVNETDKIQDTIAAVKIEENNSPVSEQEQENNVSVKDDAPKDRDVEMIESAIVKTEDQDMMEQPSETKSESKVIEDVPATDQAAINEIDSTLKNVDENDQEMAEPKTENEVDKQDESTEAVLDETVNQSICVDENRYFEKASLVELSRIAWKSQCDKQQYVRGCLWSPDGTCILAAVNMDGMHVMNLGTDLYTVEQMSSDRPVDKLESVINVKEGGTVYDYCWYPFMNSTMPETCCWLSSRQHCPIQLWDGFNGDLRGSYRGYDNVDEVEAAFSVTFTSDAEKIIGGYKKTLKIFDTKSPGREYSVIPIKQPCSCLAVQETQSNIIATGSWNCAVNLYDLRAPKLGTLVTLEEHTGGVTFLKFAATGDSLFSGARKDNKLLEWDMRNFSKPIRQLSRTVKTNQRIYFDLSPGEKWLASGDTGGLIHVWDLKSQENTEQFSFELHRDCCNGVSFHPSRPMLATCSGQYHFLENIDANGTNACNEIYENSLIFWWIGKVSDSDDDEKMTKVEKENDNGCLTATDVKMES